MGKDTKSASLIESRANEAQVLCPCFEFTYRDLINELSAAPTLSFDALMEKTKIGTKCTACMLDLEYFFVETTAKLRAGELKANGKGEKYDSDAHTEKPSLKQRAYALLDTISPMAHPPARHFAYYLPIIAGDGIDQFLWIANRSMLFKGEACAPGMDVELAVRDSAGNILHENTYRLERESELRVNVSGFLPRKLGEELAVGSMYVMRKADEPGFRGTTRPQLEIVARRGAACVHGQSPAPTDDSSVTLMCRPEDERIFFSIVNATAQELPFRIAYPLDINLAGDAQFQILTIPPHGAALHEISLNEKDREQYRGKPFNVRWGSPLASKIYVMCVNPDLSAFSVDHL